MFVLEDHTALFQNTGLALEFWGFSFAEVFPEAVEPTLHDHEVLKDELLVDVFEVAQRVDRTHGVSHGIVLEGSQHHHQCVNRAQLRKVEGCLLAMLLGDAGYVHVSHRGGGGFLGLVHRAQRIETCIRHSGHTDLNAAVARRRRSRLLASQKTKERRFAACRQAHDADFHLVPPPLAHSTPKDA